MESRPGLNHRACQFDLRLRFGDFAQPSIGSSFLLQGLQQQPCFVRPVEAARVGAGVAVRRRFRSARSAAPRRSSLRIARIVCRSLDSAVRRLLEQCRPGQPHVLARRSLAPVREDQLEPLEVQARLVAVALRASRSSGARAASASGAAPRIICVSASYRSPSSSRYKSFSDAIGHCVSHGVLALANRLRKRRAPRTSMSYSDGTARLLTVPQPSLLPPKPGWCARSARAS